MASDGISLCQFRADTFLFNGIDMSDKYNLYFITTSNSTNSSSSFINNGLSINLVEDDSVTDIKSLSQAKRNYFDIDVTIAKIVNNIIQPTTKTDLDEINMILFRSKYCPLEVDGLIINCIITKSTSYFNNINQGYINLTLHCEPYYRSAIITKEIVVKGWKNFSLENKSNIDDLLNVNIEIELFDDDNMNIAKIYNVTNGTQIEFENLIDDNEKHFVVYGESNDGVPMNYVQSVDDSSVNMLNEMATRKWIKLSYGVNNFRVYIQSGRIRISYQNKIMLR